MEKDFFEDNKKCLASLALFRELYDQKKDMYSIIEEFIKEVIISNSKYVFTVTEITNLLNDTYEFEIPEAIINTCLNRFKKAVKKEHGQYKVINGEIFLKRENLNEKYSSIVYNNNLIIEELFKWIENKSDKKLEKKEKEDIIRSFCEFIVEERVEGQNSQYITGFIISCNKNIEFRNMLNKIKEGVILYSGLKYNLNLNEIGSWKTELTIFIETEMLFHFAGFNGELYKTLFDDFFKLVQEINEKNKRKRGKELIHLKYFTEVKDEIDRFFKKAEDIVLGKIPANPAKTAMIAITDGCQLASEVVQKKMKFYELLEKHFIYEDIYEYYLEDNHKYNIEDENIVDEIYKKTGIEKVSEHLKILNFVKIRRGGLREKNFENVRFLLLSGTKNTLKISYDELIKDNGEIPLALSLEYLTNKFWFKLNKGFGGENYPKTFDIVTKAQTILSGEINDSVSKTFEKLKVDAEKGIMTPNLAVATIIELRNKLRKPEEINELEIGSLLNSIGEDPIEVVLKEKEMMKSKQKKQDEENKKLKEELEKNKEELEKNREEIKKLQELEFEKIKKKKEFNKKILIFLTRSVYFFVIIALLYVFRKNEISFWLLCVTSSLVTIAQPLNQIKKRKKFNIKRKI